MYDLIDSLLLYLYSVIGFSPINNVTDNLYFLEIPGVVICFVILYLLVRSICRLFGFMKKKGGKKWS